MRWTSRTCARRSGHSDGPDRPAGLAPLALAEQPASGARRLHRRADDADQSALADHAHLAQQAAQPQGQARHTTYKQQEVIKAK